MKNTRYYCALFLAAALVIGGCGSNRKTSKPEGDLHEIKADRSANKAQTKFEKSRDPKITAETHFAAGQLAESRGEYALAAEQYHKALKLEPKSQMTMYRLGVVYSAQRKFPAAIDMWQKYVKATDESPQAYSNLGFCYELAAQYTQAEEAYQKGIKKDPKNMGCRVNYGLMLARQGKANEATIQLQAVLTAPEVHYNLASVYESQGKKTQARQQYQAALKLAPDFKDAQTRLDSIE